MRNSRNLWQRTTVLWTAVLVCVCTLVLGPALALASPGKAGLPGKKADPAIVLIDELAAQKKLEMPPAVFPHEKHVEKAVKRGKDCSVCHTTPDQGYVFQGLPGKRDAKTAEQQYHKNCITCHEAWDDGPKAAQCAQCHIAGEKPFKAASVPFDRSLHALHIESKSIPASEGAPKGSPNCGACHHVLDPITNKLVWKQGEEDACAACHAAEAVNGVISLKDASHRSCVTCHVELGVEALKAEQLVEKTEAEKADSPNKAPDKAKDKRKDKEKQDKKAREALAFPGPVTCAGCHNPAQQADFPKMKDPPRLMRGQPDATVILPVNNTAADAGAGSTMKPVVFNHKAHEAAVDSCRVCHHVRIDNNGCGSCHTVEGVEAGKFVTSYEAMHKPDAQMSCVGCHKEVTREKADCAGCHVLIPNATKAVGSDASCGVCHVTVPGLQEALSEGKTVGNDRRILEKAAADYLAGHKTAKPLSSADVPETVTIGTLSSEYEPSVFPHRKIYEALIKGTEGNAMAQAFHASPETTCAACHHNVPVENLRQPPKCVTCHSDTVGKAVPGQPVPLKQAYHQQCMACHEIMNVKPVATDCAGCHAQKPEAPAGRTAR